MALKITVTITDDVYPETTTLDVQATQGDAVHTTTKHIPKSYFWSHYEQATKVILDEVRIEAMRRAG